jgi:hypothetical protein
MKMSRREAVAVVVAVVVAETSPRIALCYDLF